jgi:hypothetical protein
LPRPQGRRAHPFALSGRRLASAGCRWRDRPRHLEDFVALRGDRNAQLVVRPLLGDLEAHVHDDGLHGLGHRLEVLLLLHVEAQTRPPARVLDEAVQDSDRVDEIAGERAAIWRASEARMSRRTSLCTVPSALVEVFPSAWRGERAAEDDLRLGPLHEVDHRHERLLLAVRRLLEVDQHPFGNDAGGIVAERATALRSVAFSSLVAVAG